MPYSFPIGVANSVSSNFDFDPVDTIEFAENGRFDILQIYLNEKLLQDSKRLKRIVDDYQKFEEVYFHAEGYLNEEFLESPYRESLYQFLEQFDNPKIIIHFDERSNIDVLIKVVEKLGKLKPAIFVENYFQEEGKETAEKNLKKFLALFTLSNNFGTPIFPVLDIPRLFNKNLAFEEADSLEWCYQILNFFGNRRIPLLLHLIDASDSTQSRSSFTTLGEGIIPYGKIFDFILKTKPALSGAILEFEDKMNPISSRDYLRALQD